ncbi:ROK family protein [Streptomyces sp. NBC_01077]|uniref:ROK family protein n=1 Tax=Streptomyces sp. NBC_01077 TaxID=2903746 RepID=UPI00386CF918|nr:ROK family protein [Streptomyces sp. NBC_01077]
MSLVAGIDIGGTKTAAGLVDPNGTLMRRHTLPTPAADGPEAVVAAAVRAVRELGEPVAAVGVGSAGVVDPTAGRIVSATDALPGWAGTELRRDLEQALGVPVSVDNDVHAHALGEAWLGAAAGHRHVLLVAVGTGIGGSLLIDGRVHHGARSVAGHAGHVPVPSAAGAPCTCGGTGHAEAVGSGPALLAAYLRRGTAPAASVSEVSALASAGDAEARRVLGLGARALGEALGGIVNMTDPELVLVGGGVSGCGPEWWEPLREAFAAELLPPLRGVELRPGSLGGDAAVLGAARLALEVLR